MTTQIQKEEARTETKRHQSLIRSLRAAAIVAIAAVMLLHSQPAVAYVSPTTRTEQPGRVLRGFDDLEHNWQPGHRGVDLDADIGQTIYAAGDGTVAFVGSVVGTPTISIDHEPGKRTTYQPVHAFVEQGDHVTEGQAIGILQPSTDGYPGLHWGLLTGKDQYANPLSLLDMPVIRLKPVDGHS